MSMRLPEKKKKKNPYRLSSDRQPGITKANKPKKKKKSIKDVLEKLKKRKPEGAPKRKMPPGKIFKIKPGQKIYDQDGKLLN
tara:strand:- start:30 stop:275 length:246 start_codon:yes stop_codon:yes gene_type:complete